MTASTAIRHWLAASPRPLARRRGPTPSTRSGGTRSIEASTKEGQALGGGDDVGSPVLAFGEPRVGIFGPIVSPAPSGAAAVTLLEQVVALAAMPAFFELKRGRTGGPQLGPRP